MVVTQLGGVCSRASCLKGLSHNLPTMGKTPFKPHLKVLHLITRSIVAGAQDNTFLTVERHDRSKYEVHIASNPEGGWYERARTAADVAIPLSNMVRNPAPRRDVQVLVELFKLMRRERYDVVHTHTAKAGFLGRLAAKVAGVPVILHTYHAFPFDGDYHPLIRKTYVGMERGVEALTDHIITLSERDRQAGAALGVLDLKRSSAIYTGIDFDRLRPERGRGDVRRLLGVPEHAPLVMQVGRLEYQKAPVRMVEAFSRIRERHPGAHLVMVGEGDLKGEVEERVRERGLQSCVHLLGLRDDVPDLLGAADVFAFSSNFEPMGRSMIEAMLMGVPVVVPAVGGIPEVVRHDETGRLYPPQDEQALADNISYLLSHPQERKRLGDAGQALARERFNGEQMVREIEALYERLLDQKASARGDRSPSCQATNDAERGRGHGPHHTGLASS